MLKNRKKFSNQNQPQYDCLVTLQLSLRGVKVKRNNVLQRGFWTTLKTLTSPHVQGIRQSLRFELWPPCFYILEQYYKCKDQITNVLVIKTSANTD